MPTLNRVVLMGNLVENPKVITKNSSKITKIRIAVDEYYKNHDETAKSNKKTHFFNCTAFGKKGEDIARCFSKGRKIVIDGKLEDGHWVDEDSKRHNVVNIIINSFEFADDKIKKEEDNNEEEETVGTSDEPEFDNLHNND